MSDEKTLTVGQLKEIIKNAPDDLEIGIDTEARCFTAAHVYSITGGSIYGKDLIGHDLLVLCPSYSGAYHFEDLSQALLKELQVENEKLRALVEMVEDHRKMPHQHIESQDKLYCLTERAREILEELKEGKNE